MFLPITELTNLSLNQHIIVDTTMLLNKTNTLSTVSKQDARSHLGKYQIGKRVYSNPTMFDLLLV